MNTIDLEVDGDVLRIAYGARRPAVVIENAVVVSDTAEIQAIGVSRMDHHRPNRAYRVRRPFDVPDFDPALAEAVIRYFVTRKEMRSGNLLRWALGRGAVRLQWPSWPKLSPDDRRSFLLGVARIADVEINGQVAVHGSRARPIAGIRPTIHDWAVANDGPFGGSLVG